jgi:hypothetical protein
VLRDADAADECVAAGIEVILISARPKPLPFPTQRVVSVGVLLERDAGSIPNRSLPFSHFFRS